MTDKYTPPIYSKYDHPSEIRDDESLTHTEKMSMLETWAADARLIAEAASEGMTDQEGGNEPLLQDVQAVLDEIKSGDNNAMHGEGNAEADRRYRENLQDGLKSGTTERDAKAAADAIKRDKTLEEAAERTAKVGPSGKSAAQI